ncbi:hypothetical protein LCGC14_0164970 [marine sediment metagenome]|uniref:Uncharacterized protein n=1 Tax=marine sediment metagenome TaxID=412755 RepID=A0A0F9XWQ7_9ZZZZ
MLLACIMREDCLAFRKHVNYWWNWRGGDRRKFATVSKFVPGDHFHVKILGDQQKFDTLAEAQEFIVLKGYTYGKLIEKHVYTREGG